MKKIVLDTNAYTRLLTGDENVLAIVASAETVYMFETSTGKLCYLIIYGPLKP